MPRQYILQTICYKLSFKQNNSLTNADKHVFSFIKKQNKTALNKTNASLNSDADNCVLADILSWQIS